MQGQDLKQAPLGAYVDLETLIGLRFPARQVDVTKRRRALSQLAGANRANFRGRGIDFDEVRSYQPGDDIRAIDWRVTARTGTAHTKLFHEERERPVLVVVDQRAGMFFGSTHCCKSVLAAHLGALIAWSALESGERVGGLVFNHAGHRDVRPRRSRKTVLSLLSTICDFNTQLPGAAQDSNADLVDLLGKLRRIARPGSSVFLISDFTGLLEDSAREHLFQLNQHVEITALQCTDPLELELPPAGLYTVTDGRSRSDLSTADRRLRERYRNLALERQDALVAGLGRLGIPLLQASTGQSPFALLGQTFGERR